MKRNLIMLASGLILLMMTGCPYESPVPLGDACQSVIDPALPGTWVIPASGRVHDTLVFMKFSSHEYYIEDASAGRNSQPMVNRARGFVTVINGVKFLNFIELNDSAKYLFFKYKVMNDRMVVWSPSDNFIKQEFSSEAEIVAYFIRNMEKDGFFEPPDTARRLSGIRK